MNYNKEEVMKAWREQWHIKLVNLAQELTPYPELEEKMFQFWEEKTSTALDSAYKAGEETTNQRVKEVVEEMKKGIGYSVASGKIRDEDAVGYAQALADLSANIK